MTLSIRNMMTRQIETIDGSRSVQEAAKKMKDKNVSSLIVVDDKGKPQGLVTERDLVRKVCINDVPMSRVTNEEIMSSPIITIDSNSSASETVDIMLRDNIRHLMVIDKNDANKPVGIIAPLDLRQEEYTDEGLKRAIKELSEYYR
jgi:signal-transduction protein with cAMP-binding, CBS, and nucleotidyltransferase domain